MSPHADRGKYSKWLTFYKKAAEGRRTSVCQEENNGKWPGNMLIAFHARLRFACQPREGHSHVPGPLIGSFWPGGVPFPHNCPQSQLLQLPFAVNQCRRTKDSRRILEPAQLSPASRAFHHSGCERDGCVDYAAEEHNPLAGHPSGQTRKANAGAFSFTSCVVLLRPKSEPGAAGI